MVWRFGGVAREQMAARLKLEPVGWIITTLPREGAKYGGKVFLSSAEIRQAARFQHRYKDENGHSRFVTVVLERTPHALSALCSPLCMPLACMHRIDVMC